MLEASLEPRGSVPGRHQPVTKSGRVILALDLGTVTGWALHQADAGITSEVAVSIAPTKEGCLLTIDHLGWPRADASERHRGGWCGALERLDRVLEHGG